MVSVLAQRQQREAAKRKERLLAARQAASALSVRQARSYQKQKHDQELSVREDARQQWLESRACDVTAIDGMLAHVSSQEGEAQEVAARHEFNLQAEACEEAAAWRAERQLEAARHRLAVVYTRVEAHERARPSETAQQRRAAVREREKARAARAAATAPAPFSLSSALGGMQAPPVATHSPLSSIPVPQPTRESPPAAAIAKSDAVSDDAPRTALPAPRRWRMSRVAPHVHVTLSDAATHHAASHGGPNMSPEAAADEALPASVAAYAEECLAIQQQRSTLVKEGQERAAQRAASVLLHQRAMELKQQEEAHAQRERHATIKEHYRQPFEETVASEGKEDTAAKSDTRAAVAVDNHINNISDHQHHRPRPPHPSHRPTRHQKAYLKGEEEFRVAFVEAPPVMLRIDEHPTSRASLSELLRPVKMTDLLYNIAHPSPAVDSAPTPTSTPKDELAASPGTARQPPMPREMPTFLQPSARARVLPSAPLHTVPLDHRSSVSHELTEPVPADKVGMGAPLGGIGEARVSPPPPPPGGAVAPLSTPLNAPAEVSTEPSSLRLAVPGDYRTPPRTPSPEGVVIEEEVVAISPLTPAPQAANRCMTASPLLPLPCREMPVSDLGDEATLMSAPDTDVPHRQKPPVPVSERKTTTRQANISAALSAPSTTQRTPAHLFYHRQPISLSPLSASIPVTSESTELPSGSSSVSSQESSSTSGIDESSYTDDSYSTGASSSCSMPVMTAEQLKLALLRLRSRIRSAQL